MDRREIRPRTPVAGRRWLPPPVRWALLLPWLLTSAACASARPQPAPREGAGGILPAAEALPPAAVPETLEPSPAAVRAAERAVLTGLETGTMWTFENPPFEYWDSAYGFRPSGEWLEHVRLSTLRYGEICSASFVSPEGLVVTNQHCARPCAEAVSTEERDYVVEGFRAPSRDRELLCPGLFLDQLVEITDLTDRVKGASTPAGPGATVAAQEAEQEAIEKECEAVADEAVAAGEAAAVHCQVVSLYHGGQYQLYRYHRYSPVKLVFLPELQAGFFGGDPDNFTYPRYALDVAFLRAYRADSAAALPSPHHFSWDPEGAREEELVFLIGNPGSTSRLATVARLMYEQRYRHPLIVQILEGQRSLLRTIASRGPEAERAVRDDLFGVENSLKAFTGQLAGLRDTTLIGRKIRWEREFRNRVLADSALRDRYGDAWNRIAELQLEKLRVSPRLNVNNPEFLGGPYEQAAATLVRYIRETAKPVEERSPEFRGEALARVQAFLRGPLRPDPEVATRLLTLRLDIAARWLAPEDPFRRLAFRPGESPEAAARRLVRESRITDTAFREELMEKGSAALAATTDPLVRLAAAMEGVRPELVERWERVTAAERVEEERLADALFAAFGTHLPPDATFTLRISDGVVRRYPYNGTFAAPFTTFHGLYERAYAFQDEMPWSLPASFRGREDALALATPLDFVTTNDITGGNSGSPIVDRSARIVGVAFDGNVEQLPNEFLYTTEAARAIGVHSAGITEALRNVYGAGALLEELLGAAGPAVPPSTGRPRTDREGVVRAGGQP